VRYAETDQSGVVYMPIILSGLKSRAENFSGSTAWDYARESKHMVWSGLSSNSSTHYFARAYGDIVTVRAWIEELHSRAMKIRYEVVREGKRFALVLQNI